MPEPSPTAQPWPRWVVVAILLGLYLTIHGYQSRDGDQAYRLPLLLHRQDPRLFADDPFVRALDAFNPHRGYLALLDLASRPLGLSAALAVLYSLTCVITFLGIDRLARAAWPDRGRGVGVVAFALVLLARAGNIGTNHLFEGTLLDRLIGFGLGWLALAGAVHRAWARAAAWIGLVALIHPSIGLQLALLGSASFLAWAIVPVGTGVRPRDAMRSCTAMALAIAPAAILHGGNGAKLFEGLPAEEFRLLTAYLQSPQHMIPHLWRWPQVAAWGCYFVVATLALFETPLRRWPRERVRLLLLLVVDLIGLAFGWFAVEGLRDLGATLFQPFRMATVARGLALVAIAGRVDRLWRRGDPTCRIRAALLAAGLVGDRALIVATAVELVMAAGAAWPIGLGVLGAGLGYLARHDTESGHWALMGGLVVAAVVTVFDLGRVGPTRFRGRTRGTRLTFALVGAWVVPALALIGCGLPVGGSGPARVAVGALVARCRFAEVPIDDGERLAVWCRRQTPEGARFVVPPGLKTFRLWSRRAVAFNRAAGPYHASGLADWADRFRDHVGYRGSLPDFVRAYLADRHGLERRYQAMTSDERAALARRQGAMFVIATAPAPGATPDPSSPLEPIHVEGRLAVYRLRQGIRGREAALVGTPREGTKMR
ncbi:MAG TPA: DUF6798 domain-containing protein [Isosphaeraceae bacterium]|jgi:hypothetical protein|nr:DUF6798 domain-containing protein [Isosphaeraceae bacterium]